MLLRFVLSGYSKAPNRNFHKNVLLISASNVFGGLFRYLLSSMSLLFACICIEHSLTSILVFW